MTVRPRRLISAFLVAVIVAFALPAVLRADGPYNDNWSYCRRASIWDPLYWYFRCYLPDDPELGLGRAD